MYMYIHVCDTLFSEPSSASTMRDCILPLLLFHSMCYQSSLYITIFLHWNSVHVSVATVAAPTHSTHREPLLFMLQSCTRSFKQIVHTPNTLTIIVKPRLHIHMYVTVNFKKLVWMILMLQEHLLADLHVHAYIQYTVDLEIFVL